MSDIVIPDVTEAVIARLQEMANIKGTSLQVEAQSLMKKHPSLPIDYLMRLVRRHGSLTGPLLKGVRSMSDLGELFGAGATMLSEREIDYFVRQEWARKPDDILWRRTKCGLHMDVAERERAGKFIDERVAALRK